MFVTIFKIGYAWGALCLVQLAIKLLDDYLDREEDGDDHRFCLADVMGEGILAYALLLYAVAARLSPEWTFTIFLSSYACGMLGSNDWLLPTGVPAWIEIVCTLLLGLLLTDWREMLSSWLLVSGVHLLDDVLDEKRQGQQVAVKNLAYRWGRIEACLLGIMFSLSALFLAPLKTFLSWLALPSVIYVAANPWKAKKKR